MAAMELANNDDFCSWIFIDCLTVRRGWRGEREGEGEKKGGEQGQGGIDDEGKKEGGAEKGLGEREDEGMGSPPLPASPSRAAPSTLLAEGVDSNLDSNAGLDIGEDGDGAGPSMSGMRERSAGGGIEVEKTTVTTTTTEGETINPTPNAQDQPKLKPKNIPIQGIEVPLGVHYQRGGSAKAQAAKYMMREDGEVYDSREILSILQEVSHGRLGGVNQRES